MADVFLSYARPSAAMASRVAKALGEADFSVWYDSDLPAHRTYSDVIASELESAKAVLVLWSADAVESQWVRSEANRARELGKLVQARLDEARLPIHSTRFSAPTSRAGAADAGIRAGQA